MARCHNPTLGILGDNKLKLCAIPQNPKSSFCLDLEYRRNRFCESIRKRWKFERLLFFTYVGLITNNNFGYRTIDSRQFTPSNSLPHNSLPEDSLPGQLTPEKFSPETIYSQYSSLPKNSLPIQFTPETIDSQDNSLLGQFTPRTVHS